QIEVQPSYGLTDEQVENMLLESYDFAEEDFRQRQVIEARGEADTILTALAKGKKNEAWGLLGVEERKNIAVRESELIQRQAGEDYDGIRKGIDALNVATTRLAEMMMDTAVSDALKGKTMAETDVRDDIQAGHAVAKADFK